MPQIPKYPWRMDETLRQKVFALLLSGKPLHTPEVVALTGCTTYQASQCRKWLKEQGHNIPVKKQKRNLTFNLVPEVKKGGSCSTSSYDRSEVHKKGRTLKQRLDALEEQRELARINSNYD